MKLFKFSIPLLLAVVFLSACKNEKETVNPTPTDPGLQIPDTYSSANYDSNVVLEKSLQTQLSNLNTYMKKGAVATNTLTADSLNWYFASAGSPTVKSATAGYYQNKIEGANGYFAVMAASSGRTWNYTTAPNANGGVIHNRLVDRYGTETLEVVDKGLYGALIYNRIADLLLQPLNDSLIDRMVAIYGASPAFPNTNNVASTPTPDAYLANYAARRDKNDGNGIYTQIKKAFLKLQAAVRGGSKYDAEKNQAIADLKLNLEKALMATAANYCHSATTKLSATTQDSVSIASALHDLGEAVGFIHGLKAVYPSQRRITDAEIDQMLNNLLFPPDGTPATYLFVTQAPTYLPKLQDVLNAIQSVYGFSATEMNDFKQNWVSVQGR